MCIAAPIFDAENVVAAISMSCPTVRIDEEGRSLAISAILKVTTKLSELLGYHPSSHHQLTETGYRSINHLGSLSPAIFVGAHISRSGLARHYRLQNGEKVPEHGLLYFSSVGPSYTSQLRPSIVALGSALSANALINGGSGMMNGTSMAAPIAAGATAALLSLARKQCDSQS